MTRFITTTLIALGGLCALSACESDGSKNDGISRFAGTTGPYYGPGSVPREPVAPEVPAAPAAQDAPVAG